MITLLHGDNTVLLPTLDPQSVQCIVTSPPYYGLRDYGLPPTHWPEISYAPMPGLPMLTIPAMDCCLGLESTLEAYVAHLVHVFRLAWPILRDDGTLWLNLGDGYAQDSKSGGQSGGKNYTSAAGGLPRTKRQTGLGDKQMLGIPWRVAFALQADSWYFRADNIWHKPNGMPDPTKDRTTKVHEYVFHFAKQESYYYNADAIKEPAVHGERFHGGYDKPGMDTRTKARNGRTDKQGATGKSTYTGFNEPWESRAEPLTYRNKRSVWTVSTQPYREAHFACFPEKLIEPCILAGSRPGDTVLDMYGGSGTAGRVAIKHQRRAILMDLNSNYITLQEQRTDRVQLVISEAAV
jgi:DNA modification methylase